MKLLIWVGIGVVAAIVSFVTASWLFGANQSGSEEMRIQTFTGVITDIESTGLNEVSSFDVRHDGTTTAVYIREDFDYGFPIGHLQEHLGSGDPVTVEGETIDGKLYADSIEDA